MSLYPARRDEPDLSPRQYNQALRAQRSTELGIHRHALGARFQAEMARLDAQAVADAVQTSLECELDVLEYGMRRASGSNAKAELVARKIELLSNINNRRLSRHFGG